MRRVLGMLGFGVLAGAGLLAVGYFVVPYLAMLVMVGWVALYVA